MYTVATGVKPCSYPSPTLALDLGPEAFFGW